MNYNKIVEELGTSFIGNPIDFITESDLKVKLVQILRRNFEEENKEHSKLIKTTLDRLAKNSYKQGYLDQIQNSIKEKGFINRVHTEVSIEPKRRIDVVVLKPIIQHKIKWVSKGSKRFDKGDIEAAFELKFIKNRNIFPPKKKTKEPDINENKLKQDIDDLGKLKKTKTFLLIFSNKNYLFQNQTVKEKNRKGSKRGQKAKKQIEQKCKKNQINFLYVHPLSKKESMWINKLE